MALADEPRPSSPPERGATLCGASGDSVALPSESGDVRRPSPVVPTDDAELDRLRALLFRREIALLDNLSTSLADPHHNARKISEALAEAVQLRSGKDPRMQAAFEPLVDNIVRTMLRRRKAAFVESLFPLMGPSIRKSIAESFRSMLESFSNSMEIAFSWKGLCWRIEAWRSGKSFSEVVLLHTLVYRVEQVFFIHSETGIPLAHVAHADSGAQDADMVSAMLTAVQDFVRDCFARGEEGELDSLRLGEFTIFIEKNPQAYLACLIRGTPPAAFRDQLRGALDYLLVEHAGNLVEFSGDTTPFSDALPTLEACLSTRYASENKKLPLWAKAAPFLLVLAIAGAFGYFSYKKETFTTSMRHAVETLRATPGIMVADVTTADKAPWQLLVLKAPLADAPEDVLRAHGVDPGLFVFEVIPFLPLDMDMQSALDVVRGEPGLMVSHVANERGFPWRVLVLKDALADTPENVLRKHGLDPGRFAFKTAPYISCDAEIVEKRARNSVTPPDTVTMTFDGKGTLSFAGTAPVAWMAQARENARAVPGVEHVDMRALRDPMLEKIMTLRTKVEGTTIEFPLGKDVPVAQDMPKLSTTIDVLVELEKTAREMGLAVSLTVYGHADITGAEKRNYEISQARARTLAAMLYAKGSAMPIALYGMGAAYPKEGKEAPAQRAEGKEDQADRRVELRVHIVRSATANLEAFLFPQL